MFLKSKVVAAAAVLTMIGGGVVIAATSATAATPSCGGSCVEIFTHDFGTHSHPAFVLDTFKQGEKAGQPQILFRTSNSDPAEDYTVSYQGLVSDFYAAGLVSASVALHYGCTEGGVTVNGAELPCDSAASLDDFAFEIQYSPYGVDSGLCTGVAFTAVAGEKVTLEPCGVSAKTIWITDVADRTGMSFRNAQVPLINGSDSNFSQPFVLTYPASSYPTDSPRPELYVTNLTGAQGANGLPSGTVNSSQLWGGDFGVLAP